MTSNTGWRIDIQSQLHLTVGVVERGHIVAQEGVAEDVQARCRVNGGNRDRALVLEDTRAGERIRFRWQSVVIVTKLDLNRLKALIDVIAAQGCRVAVSRRGTIDPSRHGIHEVEVIILRHGEQ